ncbi:hypothetical protein M513_11384, partial [Trichuris suis]
VCGLQSFRRESFHRQVGSSTGRFIDRSVRRQVGSSTDQFVDKSARRLVVLSIGRFVDGSFCRGTNGKGTMLNKTTDSANRETTEVSINVMKPE